MKRNRRSVGDIIFSSFNYSFLTLLTIIFILPFIIIVSTSMVGEAELLRRGNLILYPHQLDFSAYKTLLNGDSILYNAYGITLMRVTIGTALNLFFTSMMAYGLSRKAMPGRNFFITIVFITMLFSGGLVPNYLLLKYLHLTDTFLVMIVPSLISAWYLIIMKGFFAQIPESLEESATIDGASPLKILTTIIIPLSLPTMATIGLFYAVAHWNAWFDATIYINNPKLMPVQVLMRRIVLTMTTQDLAGEINNVSDTKPTSQALRGAMIVITTLPIICVYPFLQKHFVKGVLTGSIKG
ncbi:carbohydrate ABC transporter permease [Paenibacillus nasutitermitis]|uniref:ABC transporter permease protein YtcP n=1 Tax=Paenibacillus nasutitermitis TaxID=1652958 RepID=A0A917DM69_9BACL|nr:carbohydrate ABC transporter permease [Paenibacillus nasutitermitis]GGD51870.1 putative ABC transporter permease protein YtcP [Paenibacillus nasutitermitis]